MVFEEFIDKIENSISEQTRNGRDQIYLPIGVILELENKTPNDGKIFIEHINERVFIDLKRLLFILERYKRINS